jgi:TonB family protein
MPSSSRLLSLLLDDYRSRMMLSVAGALLVVGGLLHVPVPVGSARVGWEVQPSGSTIHLTEVREAGPADDAAPARLEIAEAPPATRQAPDRGRGRARPRAPTPPLEPTGTDTTASSSQPLQRMTAMAVHDKPPEIVGGAGALFMRIRYPEEARRRGIQGRVVLAFTVSATGWPERIEVVRSLHPLCDSAATAAVRQTRFVPGRRGGEAVPIRMRLPIRFKLQYLAPSTRAPRESSL